MDIKEYIASGIIEACLTGSASEEDMRQLDRLCQEYPEVKKTVEEVQVTLEHYASLYATPPPEGLKEKIWDDLNPGIREKAHKGRADRPEKISTVSSPSRPGWLKYVAAAAIVLLLASVVMNIYLWNKSTVVSGKIVGLQKQLRQTQVDNAKKTATAQENLEVALSPNMNRIVLAGVNKHEDSEGLVFWAPSSQEVYLSLAGLPKPPTDKQYQLWAIIDGKPVNAGVYKKSQPSPNLQKMEPVSEHPQKFAVTLEKKGGAESPNLSAMYVAGEL